MRFPGGERQQVIDGLTERGIGSLIYYPKPIHTQDYLQSYLPGAAEQSLPVTEQLTDEVLSIPVRPSLTDDEVDAVAAAVRELATPVAELKPGAGASGRTGLKDSSVGAGSRA